ncbi:hypothetical protein AeNC1_014859 [Aphanomyces euteiches]|nr:hypothetical protein AeNC1_014859 [Aphanomyces euteiches]
MFLAKCYGDNQPRDVVPFKHHVEWLEMQDPESSGQYWKQALVDVDKALPLQLPKPTNTAVKSKYGSMTRSTSLPNMKATCEKLSVTPSTTFRSAWAILLHQYTRSEHVVFGSVVSGRDSELEGVDRMVGLLINTIPVHAGRYYCQHA